MTTGELVWQRSSYSNASGGNCVEVAAVESGHALRDSKNPQRGHLAFPVAEWRAFLAAVRAGELDG